MINAPNTQHPNKRRYRVCFVTVATREKKQVKNAPFHCIGLVTKIPTRSPITDGLTRRSLLIALLAVLQQLSIVPNPSKTKREAR